LDQLIVSDGIPSGRCPNCQTDIHVLIMMTAFERLGHPQTLILANRVNNAHDNALTARLALLPAHPPHGVPVVPAPLGPVPGGLGPGHGLNDMDPGDFFGVGPMDL
jgi:hypothetical protein